MRQPHKICRRSQDGTLEPNRRKRGRVAQGSRSRPPVPRWISECNPMFPSGLDTVSSKFAVADTRPRLSHVGSDGCCLTLAPNHSCWAIILVRAEVGYIVQVLGALEKPVDGDAVLQGLAVNQRLLYRGQCCLMGIVKQRLLQLGGGCRDSMEGGGGKRGQTE